MKPFCATALVGAAMFLTPPTQAEDLDEFCATIAVTAEKIARTHQEGMALAEVLNLIPSRLRWLQEMVVAIYDGPRFQTAEHQQKAIAYERDRYHVACLNDGRESLGDGA